MPDNSGSKVPALRPNEWNIGSTLRITSCALKAKRAASCARLASRLACDSTTPLGAPSEPEVNNTTAASSGSTTPATRRWLRSAQRTRNQPRTLSAAVCVSRISSRYTIRTTPLSSPMMAANLAAPMKRREVYTTRICAARTADNRPLAPAVKFSMAGTWPYACSASTVARVVTASGSITARPPFERVGQHQMARRQQRERDGGEPAQPFAAAQPGKRRVLRALDAHRQQRGAGAIRHQARPLIHLHERPRDRDASFRKNNGLAITPQILNQRFHRQRIGRVHRQEIDEQQTPPHPPRFGNMSVHRERQPFGQKGVQQQRI